MNEQSINKIFEALGEIQQRQVEIKECLATVVIPSPIILNLVQVAYSE